MSRTVRALPARGSKGLKHFVPRCSYALKPHGGDGAEWWLQPGTLIAGVFPTYEVLFGVLEPVKDTRLLCATTLVCLKPTQAGVAAKSARDVLYWSRKNKTCRRQRRHAVASLKRAMARRARARAKALVRLELFWADTEHDA